VSAVKQRTNACFCAKDRMAQGKLLRQRVPRTSHDCWKPAKDRPNPVELLEASDKDRLPELLPIRYGRMLQSPLAFLRGAAAIMAHDLAGTPVTGLHVQACGDGHLMNFGIFASPERALVFDINDFDETLPAPWEWDVKRLAASVVVAGRHLGISCHETLRATTGCVRSYRIHMRDYAKMSALGIWYARLDIKALIRLAPNTAVRRLWKRDVRKARTHTGEHILSRMTRIKSDRRRILDRPPFVFHPSKHESFETNLREFLGLYRQSLPDDRRLLLDRYRLVDVAMYVVGVGSVGTRCAVALLEEEKGKEPLFLQFKEARPSVLEPYVERSAYTNQGQRVVAGQRLMQATSDILLGWSRAKWKAGHFDFYFRQLRDMKESIDLDTMCAADFIDYAELCGWALARAHARSGDAALIAGYAGRSDTLDRAVAGFAVAYADQTERDYDALVAAVRSGRVKAHATGVWQSQTPCDR